MGGLIRRRAGWRLAVVVSTIVLTRHAASQSFERAITGSTNDIAFETRDIALDTRDISLENRDIVLPVVQTVGVTETPRDIHVELPADILFDFDKSVIRADAKQALDQAAAIIRSHPGARLRFEGHTDSKGTDAINQPLSKRRAEAVRSWILTNASLPVSSAAAEGFAARRPAVPNTRADGSDDPEGRQRNRRVEIIISK
jgi:outer membrane protein OmpA-like peptidoglycan-associated protein